jgi:hypothetical protein
MEKDTIEVAPRFLQKADDAAPDVANVVNTAAKTTFLAYLSQNKLLIFAIFIVICIICVIYFIYMTPPVIQHSTIHPIGTTQQPSEGDTKHPGPTHQQAQCANDDPTHTRVELHDTLKELKSNSCNQNNKRNNSNVGESTHASPYLSDDAPADTPDRSTGEAVSRKYNGRFRTTSHDELAEVVVDGASHDDVEHYDTRQQDIMQHGARQLVARQQDSEHDDVEQCDMYDTTHDTSHDTSHEDTEQHYNASAEDVDSNVNKQCGRILSNGNQCRIKTKREYCSIHLK